MMTESKANMTRLILLPTPLEPTAEKRGRSAASR